MPPKRGAKRKAAEPAAAAAAEDNEDLGGKMIVKGHAAVDSESPYTDGYHVYEDASGPWSFTGNQTNIGNNNNKYYILQLLEKDGGGTFKTWTRWGRVGARGQSATLPGATLAQCKAGFEKKFRDKTKNSWSDKDNFVFYKGKYDMVHIDYAAEDDPEKEAALKAKKPRQLKDSKLPPSTQNLMKLIFDVKEMTSTVTEMNYDIKKLPLGKLTSDQLKDGFQALKHIEELIQKKASGSALASASDIFYTKIPHVFGMRVPPAIKTEAMVKEKLNLLEALGDIKIAMKMISDMEKDTSTAAVVDRNYASLNCGLAPVKRNSDRWSLVNKYLLNTHGSTHKNYTLELLDLFEVDKGTSYDPKPGNKVLLWHGSRLTNWVGILSQGLRIAPPEAPVTGYMFGKGVYFADMVSKSANYCFTTRSKNVGILLLCEVALGKPNEMLSADCTAHLHQPKGTHSTHGKGKVHPDPAATVTIDGDVKVPCGKQKDTGVVNPAGYTLAYNEFIVYDTKQVKFRYLLKVKFNYK
eukprot:m.482820 g.482820  ORF g.482820 m.482820 type:complete len:523 (-) comp22675_c0_seq1:139-1707(-)